MSEDGKVPILLLRSTSRNFPLDAEPEFVKAGYEVFPLAGLVEFITSEARRRPFLAVMEIGTRTDVDVAIMAHEWSEHMQPLAPGRYLWIVASKNLQVNERSANLGGAELLVLPQPVRSILFKLELQARLVKSAAAAPGSAEKAEGFTAQFEKRGAEQSRVLIFRGPGAKDGQWLPTESSPSGKVRWRWIPAQAKKMLGSEAYSWVAESAQAPQFAESTKDWALY